MTYSNTSTLLPDYAVSPGDFIQEWLEEHDVNAKVAYRKTSLKSDKTYERATWLALGEREANIGNLPDYDRKALEELIPTLRMLTAGPNPVESLNQVKTLLNQVGVAFSLIPLA